MDREEAKNKIHKIMKFTNKELNKEYDDVIDEIYDDFENRICANCTYFNDGNCKIFCGARAKYVSDDLDNTFSCNKFKRRRNGN